MPFKIVNAKDAPAKPIKKQPNKSADYFREIILGLEQGKVAVVTPDETQSQRGIKVSVGRIASGMGIKVTSYSVDGDENVYVSLDETQPAEASE